jgi:ABC-type multidrug transport system fused ATPase/permease subunit
VIAHRLSTIRNADKIIVLSKGTNLSKSSSKLLGQVVESGTFEELMKNDKESSIFRGFVELQRNL